MSFARYSGGGSSGFSRFVSPTIDNSDPYSTDKLDQQIANDQTRIQDAGFSTDQGDGRNWFERATNLPAGQNMFLDTLELLGRPGQAVKNVIDKATGPNATESVGEAALKGLSGQERTTGADIINHISNENGVTGNGFSRFLLGTALDIGLDPTSYIPGGAIVKGVKTAAAPIVDVAKAGYNALESAAPALKTLRESKLAPAAESAKDALGYMLKPNYKIDETLNGDKSDFVKNLLSETENSRRFKQEEALNSVAQAAKDAGGVDTGIDVGRVMEQNIPVYGPKPLREITSDPKITDAATKLMQGNQEIRQLAQDNGIDIPEMEGYMTHILSQEERNARKINKPLKVDVGQFGTGQPNKKILNARKLQGSAEDINQQLGRKFFEPNAYFATGVGQKRLIDYIHAVSLRRKVLSNPDFAVPFEKGMDIPKNAVVIDSNNYKFMKDSGDILDGMNLADKIGGQYVVTKPVKQILDRYQAINTDEGTKAFMKVLDNATGIWKKLALFSPGFHIRNAAGAMFNNYAAGMNSYELGKYTLQASQDVADALKGKESPLFKEYRKQGLGAASLSKVEFAKSGQEPEQAIQNTIENMTKTGKDKVISKLKRPFETSREAGDTIDQVNRFALYKWARDKGMTPQQAADKVREVQFDYSELTPFEQKVRKLVPFYTWMRKNIPFQVSAFINDPRKYANLNKIRQNAQSSVGLNDENMPDYMRDQFNIPVYGSNGQGKSLGLNFPLTDLFKLSSPLKTFTDSVTPLLKTPIELATNYNMFLGKPIEKFQGQNKVYQVPGTNIQAGIPMKLAYALEQLTGQPGRGLSGYLQQPNQKDQDTTFRTPSLGISSFLKPFDADKADYLQKLQELKDLQDMILYIQQQTGAKPRTIAQIGKK
jgi:hypothetical protein